MNAEPITTPLATKVESPGGPLPYNLEDLQEAARSFGLTPTATLDAAIALYERGLISYPKVDDRWLPQAEHSQAVTILKSFRLASGRHDYDPSYVAPCWMEETKGPHHGIMPTGVAAAALFGVAMDDDQRRVYALIHSRFLELFKRPARLTAETD